MGELLLEVKDLRTYFYTGEGVVRSVDGATFDVHRGRTLCVVGESGCGKSVTALSILQLVQRPGRIVGGEVLLHRGEGSQEVVDLAKLKPHGREIRRIRGKEIAMIFQEPMSSLSPVHTIGSQIVEAIRLHFEVSREEARARAIEVLRRVNIPRAERALDAYTFELSGGMRQRAMIAMALSCRPRLLIADEPTTALDVTTQAQILELMQELQRDLGMAMMFITHDLGVVAEIADEVAVMYLGMVVERGGVREIFHSPKHPYTQALLKSVPRLGEVRASRLHAIRGSVPNPYNRPGGCPFHDRCDSFMPGKCDRIVPPPVELEGGRVVRCLLYGGGEAPDQSAVGKEDGRRWQRM